MRALLALIAPLGVWAGCAGSGEHPGPAPSGTAASSASAAPVPTAPATADVGQMAPAFRIAAADGTKLDSADWVGKRPFVVVFFMTWCPICARKVQILKEVLDESGKDVKVIGVALDETETWPEAPKYAREHGLEMTLVHGAEQPAIVKAYDPPASWPTVVVVGRDGKVVEIQLGLAPGQKAKLAGAIARARL